MALSRCPVCAGERRSDVLTLPQLPVLINAQARPEDAADVVRGDIDLVVCDGCGHLYNRSFDEGLLDYDAAYENTLHYSEAFQAFAKPLARRLVVDHDLFGDRVAEFGSGPGHFLAMLCEAGVGEGVGFDPSYDPSRFGAPEHEAVRVSTEMFPDDGSLAVGLALSQHVLEHLDDPVAALAAQRAAVLSTGGAVYTEVPNGQLMLEKVALWDLIYEHLSYFVPSSLTVACQRAGIGISAMGAVFGDQFLWCEGAPGPIDTAALPDPLMVESAVRAASDFGANAAERIEEARQDLSDWANEGPVVVWGAGSKGATYLNLVADVAPIDAVIDINPRKTGWGVPGTSLSINGPEVLKTLRPRTVLVVNPVYADEVSAHLKQLGVEAGVRPLWS